ncbi:CPBP family intramembrane glutamic endopeptidase [Blastococcus mobilis]|uniref:CAAX protease self-immunity n=1 Tax=Blastococcus mobilis TaxID=1938746 RepID=A0A238USN9_9ACTN|nr:CPBP family intramembrane glutamic endopeptidase [Blastococcus mobilis]SNR25058.1 CAAX protease self-immunity [Blastococcus mobilis]
MTRAARLRRWLPLAGTSAGLLAWSNLVVPTLPSAPGVRTAANVAAVSALVLAARAGGMSWTELGLGRPSWSSGARWGSAALAVAATGYGVLIAVPAWRLLLDDPRVGAMAVGDLALRALVLIPLGTVVSEEVAFRGVLLALAGRVLGPRSAVAVTAAVFGLWHASAARLPGSLGMSPRSGAAAVAGVVVATGVGGLLLGWLRQRSGSLLAPLGAHLGSNSLGLLAARVATGPV